MKKIICLMLAVIMAFSMSVSAFAAEIDANDEVSLNVCIHPNLRRH